MNPIVVAPGVVLEEELITWTAARTSGPGGQNVNKVASKVDLRFDFEHSAVLGAEVKSRLRALAKNRLDADGRIMMVSQLTRDQPQNLADARDKLRALVAAALTPPKKRRATRPTAGGKRRRLAHKQKHSEKKRGRTRGFDD